MVSTTLVPSSPADRLIPPDSRYLVVTGTAAGTIDPRVLPWVPRFARYRLFPRRLTRDVHRADWILSYGADLDALDVTLERVVDVAPGVRLAEVASR